MFFRYIKTSFCYFCRTVGYELNMNSLPPMSRLKPFEAAARHESFSRAADELGMTQTAVSKQIAQLEQELETSLFERRNRAVFLTEEGRKLGKVVSKALSQIASEVAFLRGDQNPKELVLHCQLCEAFYWLMPRLSAFHELHPEIELRIVSSIKPLTESREHFDVAIQTSGRPSGTAHLSFTASDEIFPVCAPQLMENRKQPIRAVDLLNFPLLSHCVVPQEWMDWPDWFEAIGMPHTGTHNFIKINSFPLVLQAAVSGYGIALGWGRMVAGMINEGRLIRPCVETVERPMEISVFKGAGRNTHSATQFLLDWLSAELTDQSN